MMASIRGAIDRVKRAIYGAPKLALNPRLATLERVFRSPPMTKSLVDAIRLISPHIDIRPNEEDRRYWECEQNGTCWGEYELLQGALSSLQKPMRILEIGPGLGRSLVFFSKKLGWQDCELHAFEGNGKSTKYTIEGPRFEDSFCGTISELRNVLNYNGVSNVTIHDAAKMKMRDLPGPFNLVYGFYSIGFHWSLEHFMDEVMALIGPTGIAVFTVNHDFQPFRQLQDMPYRLLEKERAHDEQREKLLVLGPIGKV